MGLRESLQDLLTIQDLSGQFAQSGQRFGAQQEAIENKKGLREIAQELPSALESGDLTQLAGKAYGLGDPMLLEAELRNRASMAKAGTKTGDEPMPLEQLQQLYGNYLTPEQIMQLASAPSRTAQRQEASAVGSLEGKQAQMSLARTAEGRRQEDAQQKARVDFTEKVSKAIDPLRKEIKQLEELDQMDLSNTTAFWLSATNAIKTIGREAGALTDRDIGRPFPSTAIQNLNQLANWMGARDPSKTPIDPSTVASIKGIIGGLKEQRKQKAAERATMEISKAATARRGKLLNEEDRFLDPVIEEAAGEFGLVAGFDDKGKFSVGKEIASKKQKIDMDTKGARDAGEMIKKVKDPARQAKYLKALQKAGGVLPPAILSALEKEVQ